MSGLGGAPEFAEAFYRQGAALADAAIERYGLAAEDVVFLADRPERDAARIDGAATKQAIADALAGIAARAGPADRVLIVLLGHGSAREGESRFNLRGPDLGAAELATMLEPLGDRPLAVVNAASASGGFVEALAGAGRVIVTATRSAAERNATHFGEYFVRALAGADSDVDKDGRVSLLEAFDYARREVERAYEEENRLLTEHAVLEDDGDGVGTMEPAPRGGDGALAARFFLGGGAAGAAVADAPPELRALYERRDQLQEQIEALRARKAEMDPEAYQTQLEALLLELARTSSEIRAREGGTR
ncbi:MAG TPA: hypothetical protein VF188_07050 [Longimicrobiales bacterium]